MTQFPFLTKNARHEVPRVLSFVPQSATGCAQSKAKHPAARNVNARRSNAA